MLCFSTGIGTGNSGSNITSEPAFECFVLLWPPGVIQFLSGLAALQCLKVFGKALFASCRLVVIKGVVVFQVGGLKGCVTLTGDPPNE